MSFVVPLSVTLDSDGMNVVTSPPADSALRSVHTDARSVSGHALFWAFQGYVMAAVACSSFFPMLFRYQEHAVIVLVVL